MSEEIIIDGVNVAECDYFEDTHEEPDNLNGGYYIQHCYCGLQGDNYCICNKNHNCYFKQLQRLKQENEELKKYIERMDKPRIEVIDGDVIIQNVKFRQALEEIREMAKYDCKRECSNDSKHCTIESCLEKRIERLINEVLND